MFETGTPVPDAAASLAPDFVMLKVLTFHLRCWTPNLRCGSQVRSDRSWIHQARCYFNPWLTLSRSDGLSPCRTEPGFSRRRCRGVLGELPAMRRCWALPPLDVSHAEAQAPPQDDLHRGTAGRAGEDVPENSLPGRCAERTASGAHWLERRTSGGRLKYSCNLV